MAIEKTLAKIRGKRAELKLSQRNVAQILGISITAYVQKENGKRQFTLLEIYKLCDIFKCSFNDLFTP